MTDCPNANPELELELRSEWVRQWASGRAHRALFPARLALTSTILGAPCETLEAPLAVACGVLFRRFAIIIPAEHVDGWRRRRAACPTCAALERLEGGELAP